MHSLHRQPGDAAIAITTRKCANSRDGNGYATFTTVTQWQTFMMPGLQWLTLVPKGRAPTREPKNS